MDQFKQWFLASVITSTYKLQHWNQDYIAVDESIILISAQNLTSAYQHALNFGHLTESANKEGTTVDDEPATMTFHGIRKIVEGPLTLPAVVDSTYITPIYFKTLEFKKEEDLMLYLSDDEDNPAVLINVGGM
jgi:hypothetical protein